MNDRSKLVCMRLRNLGCIGPEGLEVSLDNIVCLVGRNNTGKSTVLRAYELAHGALPLAQQDRCQWTPQGDSPEVELDVHIPDGMQNVDAKWKQRQNDLNLVKSRWTWKEENGKPVRQTWDPEAGDWAEDGKAGGADNVFNSRLPKPLRVGSLQDASKEHDALLELMTGPVSQELKRQKETPGSDLSLAIKDLIDAAMRPIELYQAEIDGIGTKVGTGFRGVFPELDLRIKVGMESFNFDPAKALAAGSSVRFLQGDTDTGLVQQGTGSKRAIFWALLQVRNTILQERKVKDDRLKEAEKCKREREKELKKKGKPDPRKIEVLDETIRALENPVGGLDEDLKLPGHILLIDEPENALHPMAVRAAQNHLYALAQDPNWQVMISTHSPYFIDPIEDHTTILRLEREGRRTTPRTFRTATAKFSAIDKVNLRALLQLDTALAEMFFGSYPILVEGDTEIAAALAAIGQQDDPLATKVTFVPARGKGLIAPLVRLLTHFRVPFGVLHDTDSPLRHDKKRNGAWTENKTIADAIDAARAEGIQVRHRVSVPDFERRLGGFEETKDKPITAYRRILEEPNLMAEVRQIFQDLFSSAQLQPIDTLAEDCTSDDVVNAIDMAVRNWAANNAQGDPRFNV
jgi:putative ATP-dependent endonuclease of the OLD family